MAYTKQTWVDLPVETTPISAERLNHIEDGIEAATTTAEAPKAADHVTFAPTGSIAATDVQAAILEVVADFNTALDNLSVTASGPAGGVLSGTYPNPGFAVDMATQAELNTEITNRTNADTTLQSNIDQVVLDFTTALDNIDLSSKVSKTGDNMTGTLTIAPNSATSSLILEGNSGDETVPVQVWKDPQGNVRAMFVNDASDVTPLEGTHRFFMPMHNQPAGGAAVTERAFELFNVDGSWAVDIDADGTIALFGSGSYNNKVFRFTPTGSSQETFIIDGSGEVRWGDGAGQFIELYRVSATELKIDDFSSGALGKLVLGDATADTHALNRQTGDARYDATGAAAAAQAAAASDATAKVSAHTAASDPHGDRAYAAGLLASNDAMLFKGVIDCSTNPNYPAADAGHVYKVSVAGKIGGASGVNVEVGDTAICAVDNTLSGSQSLVGSNWFVIQANIDGAVTGPASSTTGNVPTFNGSGGKVLQDSGTALSSLLTSSVAASTYQPIDSDLTAIAALSTTTYGRSLLETANAAAARSALSLGSAATSATTDYDATGAAAAAQAAAAADATAKVSAHAVASDPHGDRAYADGLFASNDAMLFKGVIDCSVNPNYPAASAGHTYKISVAGKLGGASGVNVEVGDTAICAVDNTLSGSQALVGANWFIIQANLDGAVIGPASAGDGEVALFDGTGGKLIKDSGITLGTAASKDTGTGATNVILGNDARLTDTRTPTDGSVTSAKIVDGAVTNADMADMAAKTVKMRHTNSTGPAEDTSMANLLADASGQAAADFSFNTHKVTGVMEGAAAGEAATYAATPAGIVTAKGDFVVGTGSHTVARKAAPANGKIRAADSAQSDGWKDIDLPWCIPIDPAKVAPYSATGFASQLGLAGNYAQMTALNDEAVFKLLFGPGTWTFNLWRTLFSSYGILTVSIDGTTVATLDNYSGAPINPGFVATTGITISAPGVYDVKLKTTSKNASSSNYNQRIWGFDFTRTA